MKKTMHRLLSLTLTIALALSLAAPGFAADRAPTRKAVPVTSVTAPKSEWQTEVTFPDAYGYVDDTLAMNSLVSYTGFTGQGEAYVTPAAGVTGFRLFVNNVEVDTAAMKAGGTYRLDLTQVAVNGTNTIQLTNITPSTLTGAVTVQVPYPTLLAGSPADVGMEPSTLSAIDALISAEVKYGFSGAQLAVIKDGKLVVNEAWGAANGYNPDGTPIKVGDKNYTPVTTDTLYDLASNTKMYSVNYALQYMLSHEGYDIALTDKITKFFPSFDKQQTDTAEGRGWKSALTISDILHHQAGFNPDPQYHNDKFNQATQTPDAKVDNPLFSQTRDKTLQMILRSPLTYQPGTKTVYSDVDYMLLCFILEQVSGKGLDEFLKEIFWTPMGLTHMTYNPLKNGFTKEQCAATELNGNTRDGAISFQNVRTATVQGEVHDEKAFYAMEGISGHAGLFSNAEDLAKLASVMLSGGYGNHKFFDKNIIDQFTKPKSLAAPTWGLGWWRAADEGRVHYFSTAASSSSIGHQGWTGTLTVIDPESNLVVVLLTNKKNSPVIDNKVNANDFYSDNMVLGGLGTVVGYVYESMMSSPEAVDASLAQLARERTKMLETHKNAYDEAPHMNDSFALVDLLVTRAEQRQTAATRENAAAALADLKAAVARDIGVASNKANAAKWTKELEGRIAALKPGSKALTVLSPEALTALPAGAGAQTGGAISFPTRLGAFDKGLGKQLPTTSYLYSGSIYGFHGYQGQGSIYLEVKDPAVTSLQVFVNGQEVNTAPMLGKTGIYRVDISKATRNGKNLVQITGMPIGVAGKTGVDLYIPNPVVVNGSADQVGIDRGTLDLIDSIIKNDVANGFTSAQLAILKDGKLVKSTAYGTVNAYNPDGTPKQDSPAVTTDTLYDLASNTKMYATNYAVQYLQTNSAKFNNFSITQKITDFFPTFDDEGKTVFSDKLDANGKQVPLTSAEKAQIIAWKSQLTVQDILQHQAGFNPDPQFHNDQFNQATQKPTAGVHNPLFTQEKEKTKQMVLASPLIYQPGTQTKYSDVDFMLLGMIIEQVTGKDLDTFLKETFYTPMGLSHVTYNPLDHGFTAGQIAATELNGNSRDGVIDFTGIRKGTIQGTVHDEKAYYAMDGVSGHAGLFSNAEDLAKLCQVMLNGGGYGTNQFFTENTLDYFTSPKDTSATWGQGWWRQADGGRPWYFGVQASRGTIGHQGWTGTLTMIDPSTNMVVVLLTNKINSPVTDKTANANQFDGNWYTTSTLGVVANLLGQGLTAQSSAQPDVALDALLADMVTDKLRLVADEGIVAAEHPVVRSTAALVDTLNQRAAARGTAELKAYAANATAQLSTLTDISEGAWYYDAVRFVTKNKLFGGTSATRFSPDDKMTRSMLVTVLHRMAGTPEAAAPTFPDVAAGTWYTAAVGWANAKGIVTGANGKFLPNDSVTREQIALILYNYTKDAKLLKAAPKDAPTLKAFSDGAAVSDWAAEAMTWAVGEGLFSGKTGNRLDPTGTASRAEVATLLMRYMEKIAK